jgi:hypothetical protein
MLHFSDIFFSGLSKKGLFNNFVFCNYNLFLLDIFNYLIHCTHVKFIIYESKFKKIFFTNV